MEKEMIKVHSVTDTVTGLMHDCTDGGSGYNLAHFESLNNQVVKLPTAIMSHLQLPPPNNYIIITTMIITIINNLFKMSYCQ